MEAALYLLKRFEVSTDPPLHFSATAAVLAATDHGVEAKPRRALKAMKEASQVLAELEGRKGLDPSFVVPVVGLFVDDQVEDTTFNELKAATTDLEGVAVERSADLSARLSKELAMRSGGGTETGEAAPATEACANTGLSLPPRP